ncbi:hypothetical protein [Halobellus salinisoli]|uniref:hypothetical protein n=1 Tax=Halobellus salinisoli TaxID=3108500 RepID=UPI00300A1E79
MIASNDVPTARDVTELDPWLLFVIDCAVDATDCGNSAKTSENGVFSRLTDGESRARFARCVRTLLRLARLLGLESVTSKTYSRLSRLWDVPCARRIEGLYTVSAAVSVLRVLRLFVALVALVAIALGIVGVVHPKRLPVRWSPTAAENPRRTDFEALLCRLWGLFAIFAGTYLLYGWIFSNPSA